MGHRTWVCDWTWRQGELPAARIEQEGFGCVKLKAGGAIREGWSFVDPWLHRNMSLLKQTKMVPAVYWYLMPEKPRAQAGLCRDLLAETGGLSGTAVFLDVEQAGLNADHVGEWVMAWFRMTDGYPFIIYTRKGFWYNGNIDAAPGRWGGSQTPYLEEARWVAAAIRQDKSRPFASHHAHGIDPAWWDVNYSGWTQATLLQFTDSALVAGKLTTASLYRGTKDQLRYTLTR